MDSGWLNYSRQYAQNMTREVAYTLFDEATTGLNSTLLSCALLMTCACTIIAIGAYSTIEQPPNALDPKEQHPLFDQSDKDITFTPDASIGTNTALAMPFVASVGLLGLYFALKRLSVESLMRILNGYVLSAGCAAAMYTISYLHKLSARKVGHWLGVDSRIFNPRYTVTFSTDSEVHPAGVEQAMLLPDATAAEKVIKEETLEETRQPIPVKDQQFNYYFTRGDLASWTSSFSMMASFWTLDYAKNWLLSNIVGSMLAVFGVAKFRLNSFKVGILVMSLFFFYDIYFVFGTEVMVTVATDIEVPVKLQVPSGASRSSGVVDLSILGVGDIVLPGSLIALCLRYDLYNFHETHHGYEFHHLQKYRKPYFWSALFAYCVGLTITLCACNYFKTGQPALLYLSPSVIISVLATAWWEGQIDTIWNYDENKFDENEKDVDLLCSKNTLYLAGELDPDTEAEDDPDYVEEDDEDY